MRPGTFSVRMHARLQRVAMRIFRIVPLSLALAATGCFRRWTPPEGPDFLPHDERCRRAREIVSAADSAARAHWALEVMWTCEDAGPVLARALAKARASTDTAYLRALAAPMVRLRDGEVFEAALSVAGDRTATDESRVAAIEVLILALLPGANVNPAIGSTHAGQCFTPPGTHWSPVGGTPLPDGYVARASDLLTSLFRDRGEPERVHAAATCGWYAARLAAQQPLVPE